MIRQILSFIFLIFVALVGIIWNKKTKEEEIEELHREIERLQNGKRTNSSEKCVICLEKNLEVVFLPCGHACTCLDCTKTLLRQSNSKRNCPLCRGKIKKSYKIFFWRRIKIVYISWFKHNFWEFEVVKIDFVVLAIFVLMAPIVFQPMFPWSPRWLYDLFDLLFLHLQSTSVCPWPSIRGTSGLHECDPNFATD